MSLRAKVGIGVLVAVVLPIAVIGIAGLTLPLAHVASVHVEVPFPPDRVRALVVDREGSADWRPGVERVERLPDRDGMPCFREVTGFGPIAYVHEDVTPGARLLTRIVDNDQFGGTWEYVAESTESGSSLTVTERGEIHSVLMRPFAHLIGSTATMEEYVGDLVVELRARGGGPR